LRVLNGEKQATDCTDSHQLNNLRESAKSAVPAFFDFAGRDSARVDRDPRAANTIGNWFPNLNQEMQ